MEIERKLEDLLSSCDRRFADEVCEMLFTHSKKNADYSPDNRAFGNFEEAQRVGVNPALGAFIRLQDKYTRACNLMAGKKQLVLDESLADTLKDLANYALIVRILLRINGAENTEGH